MFPLLLRVLTIAGTFAVAAVITRRYMSHKEAEGSYDAGNENRAKGSDKVSVLHRSAGEATGPSVSVDAAAMVGETALEKVPAAGPHSENTSSDLHTVEATISEAAAVESEPSRQETAAADFAPADSDASPSLNDEARSAAMQPSKPEPAADPAEDRARIVLDSSKQILTNYKQPEGLKVDLGLAHFSLDTAERLMTQSKFDEALEKASAVGLLVGMSEMRAAVDNQLKTLKSDDANADKISSIRAALSEADLELAEASKSFFMEDAGEPGAFMNHLQLAFQKTTQAQSDLSKIVG